LVESILNSSDFAERVLKQSDDDFALDDMIKTADIIRNAA
jgi:hypothetical protein